LAEKNHVSLAKYLIVILWYAIHGYDITRIEFYQDDKGESHYRFTRDNASGFYFEENWEVEESAKVLKEARELGESKGVKMIE
jgi:hypothetical protein